MITVDQYMDIKQRLANGQSLHSIASDTGHSLSVNPNLYEVRGTELLRFLISCLS